jgi:hypothetical protein
MENELSILRSVRRWLIVFIVLLMVSGITAFPLEWELGLLVPYAEYLPAGIQHWYMDVYYAIKDTNAHYPYLFYGTDWLAFAHIVIGTAFIGPYRDPVRNIWVLQFGMIACLMVIPLAFICGPIRHIPMYHILIDCSFGVFGIIPLYLCYKKIRTLEELTLKNQL